VNDTLWKPDDKQWMAQRKKDWRQVQLSLDVMRNIKKKYYKYHKELFFTGEVDQSDDMVFSVKEGSEPFDFMIFFYEMWYHPSPSLSVFQEIFDAQTLPSTLLRARDILFKFQTQQFSEDYGMLGGREELFVKVLLPSNNWQEERWFEHAKKGYPLCMHPDLLLKECNRAAQPILHGRIFNPYAPGQYLWDYLSDNFNQVTADLTSTRENTLYRVKNFENLKDFPHDNILSVNFARSLKARFDNGEFSQALQDFYAEVESVA
jgi:hypothetical protein